MRADSRTCSLAHCQYGCEEVQGEIRCLCPSPGLQLGQDERNCVGEQIQSHDNTCKKNVKHDVQLKTDLSKSEKTDWAIAFILNIYSIYSIEVKGVDISLGVHA